MIAAQVPGLVGEHVDRHHGLAAVAPAGDPRCGRCTRAPRSRRALGERVELVARQLADLRLVLRACRRRRSGRCPRRCPSRTARPIGPGHWTSTVAPGDLRRDRAQPCSLPRGRASRTTHQPATPSSAAASASLTQSGVVGCDALHRTHVSARGRGLDSWAPAGVAQLVEHRSCKAVARGSSPLSGSRLPSSASDRRALRARSGGARPAAARSSTVTDSNGAGPAPSASARRKAAHSRSRCSKRPSEMRGGALRGAAGAAGSASASSSEQVRRDAGGARRLREPEPVAVPQRGGHRDRAAAGRERARRASVAPGRERLVPAGAARRARSRRDRAPARARGPRPAPRASTSPRPAARRSRRARPAG